MLERVKRLWLRYGPLCLVEALDFPAAEPIWQLEAIRSFAKASTPDEDDPPPRVFVTLAPMSSEIATAYACLRRAVTRDRTAPTP